MGAVSESATTEPGTVGWTYTVADDATDYLAAGQTATEKFTVTIDDGHGGTVDQIVTITVHGTNEAPTITSANDTGAVTEDVAVVLGNLSTTGSITFNDVDLIDVHTTSVVKNSGTLGGTLVMGAVSESASTEPGTVGWTYTVADNATDYLAFGQTATETFTVTIDDGHGGTVDQSVTITVHGTNEGPVISLVTTDSASTTQTETNAGLTASGTLTVTDADLSDTVSTLVTGVTHTGPTGGLTDTQLQAFLTVTPTSGLAADPADTHNLTWNFNSGTQAFNFLAVGETLVLTYAVQVSDGHTGGTAAHDVTVTINGTDDAPTAPIDVNAAVNSVVVNAAVGTTVGITALSTDVDAGDFLTYQINGGNGQSLFAIDGTTGVVTVANNDNLLGGSYTIDVTAVDNHGLAGPQSTFTIIVDEDNDSLATGASIVVNGSLVYGTPGSDDIDGSVISNGGQTIYAGAGNDEVVAGTGIDTVFGGSGNDNITGNNGADTLYGGSGNDTIIGGNGPDKIIGGTGNDLLTGGAGNDTFVFRFGDGHDTIKDFTSGDKIDLTIGINTAQVQALIDAAALGANTLDLGSGNIITFTGVDIHTLHAATDFIVH